MSTYMADETTPVDYPAWFQRLVNRVRRRYPNFYGHVPPEPVRVPDYPQTAKHLTQAEIDKRWDDYPRKRGMRRYLKNAGANAER
jgi:hypothetical protein